MYLTLVGAAFAWIKCIIDYHRYLITDIVDHLETGVVLTVPSVGLEHASPNSFQYYP